ncbi:MAG: hypothetical protein ACRDP7_39385 [Trebonia sp.]
MVEAGRSFASTPAIWVIVIVMTLLLAFWLTAIYLADRSQARASGRAKVATWPSYPGAWAREGAAGEQAAQIPEQAMREPAEAQGRHARDETSPPGEEPTRFDIPAQPGEASAQPAAESGRHAMPTQRTGESDRAERSHAGQSPPQEEDPGR